MMRSLVAFAAVGLTLLSVSMPALSETKSGSKSLCGYPSSLCGTFIEQWSSRSGSVSITGRAVDFDEDRFSFTTQVTIRNNTRCRLQVAFIGIEQGNNAMSLDPGSVYIDANSQEVSSNKTFVMSKSAWENLKAPELKYSFALSNCDD